MAKVSFAHKPKLRAYIESRGRRLPMTLSRFVRPGDRDTSCLFCGVFLMDVEHEVHRYHDGIEGAEATGAYMCGVCFIPVKEMETKLAGEDGYGAMFDTFGMGDRLELFSKELNFQTDVHSHYQHLDTVFEVRPKESDLCYFCKNVSSNNYFRLRVPVSGADYLTGGDVRCCFSCRDMLLELLVEKNFAKFYENKGITKVECSFCEEEYMVYPGEFEYRLQGGLLAEHLCPKCTYKNIAAWQTFKSPALQYVYMTNIEGFRIKRFQDVRCAYCETPFDIDITLPSKYITKHFISAKDIFMCVDCAHGTVGPIVAFVYNGKVWAVYNTQTVGAYRVIVRTLSGRTLLERTIIGELGHIILNSYNTLEKFMDSEQLKLTL